MGNYLRSTKIQSKSDESSYNIRSKYILQKIFSHLPKKKLLLIVKHNKSLIEKLDLSIKDYKDYAGQYAPIEIEIIPLKGKSSQFISIPKPEEEKYYHIYFKKRKSSIV